MLLKRVQQQPVLSFQGMSQLLASSRQYRETPGISKVQSTNFPNSRSVTFPRSQSLEHEGRAAQPQNTSFTDRAWRHWPLVVKYGE